MRSFAVVCSIFAFIILISTPASAIIYVKWDSPGSDFDGKSWDTAFHKVQEGINAAVAGDEVWVARGTYYESVRLSKSIGLYGGFAGWETARGQRDTGRNATILDGSKSSSYLGVVAFGAGATPATIVDGFTITNARAYPAVKCTNSSPTISNNRIIRNRNSSPGSSGGVISCQGGAPLITSNLIAGNQTAEGGPAIYCAGSSPTIAGNTVMGNAILVHGPGLARSGGAVVCSDSTSTIANNTIKGNAVGGIACSGGSATITSNTIVGNACLPGIDFQLGLATAGGVVSSDCAATISNNIIAFNSSGLLFVKARSTDLRANCVYGSLTFNYSGVPDPTGTDGNISADPKLAAFDFGDMHIQPDSPCVDAGDDSAVQPGWLDMDGQPRILGTHVDIGADESDLTTWAPAPITVRVRPDGDDANDGLDWGSAKRTVQAAVDAVSERGGAVWVSAGRYREAVLVWGPVAIYGGFAGGERALGERQWIANRTILDGSGAAATASVQSGLLRTRIDGLTICGAAYAQERGGEASGISARWSSIEVAHCSIINNAGTGVSCNGGTARVYSSEIEGNSGGGVGCWSACATVVNNSIVHNSSNGYSLSGSGGIWFDYRSRLAIANNILAFNSYGVYVYEGGPGLALLLNNCVYGNAVSDYFGIANKTGVNGNVSVDPRFAGLELGDLHLQPDSPCVNAGENDYVPDDLDIDGETRVQGGQVDIGADESDGTTHTFGPTVVRVSPDGDDGYDGSTWEKAKRTVQSAVDSMLFSGGEVWVRSGTYTGPVVLGPYVGLYGGFAGSEGHRSQRDWVTNVTALEGPSERWVISVCCGLAPTAVDGFTVRNGSAGIFCGGSCPAITNSIITGNRAGISGTDASLNVCHSVIKCNSRMGILCTDSAALIANNTVEANGGGISGSFRRGALIHSNMIVGNVATSAVGIQCSGDGWTIANNTIVGSLASASGADIGAGITCYGSGVLANNIIAYNASGIRRVSLWWLPPKELGTRNNCVYRNGCGNYIGVPDRTGTDGNISADPGFADALHGDWHIQADSPCVNAGSDGDVQPEWLDVDRQPRTQGAHVDIGADESDGTTYPQPTPVVVRVSPAGNDDSDGSSWALAKATIQAAADAAAAQGGEVWVGAGAYVERVALANGVSLYGGFAGNELRRDQRDPGANPTTMDGGAGGCVVTLADGVGSERVIDGLTIRNGKGSKGAAICCRRCLPTISNCHITGNNSPSGGAVYITGVPGLVDCTIMGNTGAGIYCSSGGANVTGCTVAGNTGLGLSIGCGTILNSVVRQNKDGIDCSGDVTISSCLIHANTGIGVYCGDRATPVVINNTIVANAEAIDFGDLERITIANNAVVDNSKGVVRRSVSGITRLTVQSNCVFGNSAYNYSGISPGPTDISLDPLFLDPSHGDYHLRPGSPCIDAGTTDGAPSADLDAVPRPRDGNGDGVALPDIGCYECPANYVTAAGAKALADGSPVGLARMISTAAFDGRFYAESASRLYGIGVLGAGHATGRWLTIEGTMATVDGERVMSPASIFETGPAVVPSPWLMNLNSLGGGPLGLQQGVSDWRPVWDPAAHAWRRGLVSFGGANNVGLLVKTTGRVSSPGSGFFYLDSSCAFDDGDKDVKGVRVDWPFADPMPAEGSFVEVVGVSSCTVKGGEVVRMLRPVSAGAARPL